MGWTRLFGGLCDSRLTLWSLQAHYKILQQDPEVATGAGHHSIMHVPGSEDYYIVYRRPLGDKGRDHRATCIDK